ncbi:MAG: hypothetical protein WBW93_16640 [Steroidobacteraceae bacterium]
MPLLLQKHPDRPPCRVLEPPAAALSDARRKAGSKRPPILERPSKSDHH